jgi:hypothetical protein
MMQEMAAWGSLPGLALMAHWLVDIVQAEELSTATATAAAAAGDVVATGTVVVLVSQEQEQQQHP